MEPSLLGVEILSTDCKKLIYPPLFPISSWHFLSNSNISMSGLLQQCGKGQADPETYLNVPMHLKTQGMLQAS